MNSCRHGLAAANLWSLLSVLEVKIRHLFNFAVPVNEFVNLSLLSDERTVDLEMNLLHFRDTYDRIVNDHEYRTDNPAGVRGTPYRRVGRLHVDDIEAQRREVEGLLDRLAALKAASDGPITDPEGEGPTDQPAARP